MSSLSIHLSVDIYVAPTFWLLEIMLQWTLGCVYPFVHLKKKIGATPHGIWDWTHASCVGRQSFNHWIATEGPILALSKLHFGIVGRWPHRSGGFGIPSHETIWGNWDSKTKIPQTMSISNITRRWDSPKSSITRPSEDNSWPSVLRSFSICLSSRRGK